jgi:hypothetical protein
MIFSMRASLLQTNLVLLGPTCAVSEFASSLRAMLLLNHFFVTHAGTKRTGDIRKINGFGLGKLFLVIVCVNAYRTIAMVTFANIYIAARNAKRFAASH